MPARTWPLITRILAVASLVGACSRSERTFPNGNGGAGGETATNGEGATPGGAGGGSLHSGVDVATLSGLVVDFDASAGVTTETGVAIWEDRTGGATATQITPAAQPFYNPAWRNGKGAVQGDAGKNLQATSLPGGDVAPPCTWLVVGTFATTDVTLMFDGAGDSHRQGFARNASGNPTMTHGTATGTEGNAIVAGTPFVGAFVFGAADSESRMVIHADGAKPQDQIVDPDGSAQTVTGITIGATVADSNHWDGAIARIVLVRRALSEAEIQDSLAFLKEEYAIKTE